MLNMTQWIHVRAGASGSSFTSANDRVPSGTSDHSSLGEMSAPSAVCILGIGAP